MDILHQFGDPAKFAIRYCPVPELYNYRDIDKMALCHMIIDNIVIGNPDEECHLPSWYKHIVEARDFIKANKDDLYRREFDRLTDREIYELILKTNQRQNLFDKNYLYLPQLSHGLWQRHLFRMDETIDAYIICFYIKAGQITFIADKWWIQGHGRNKKRFIFKTVPLASFLKTLDDTIYFLELCHPYLTEEEPEESPMNMDPFSGLV